MSRPLARVIEKARGDPAMARFHTTADIGGCWHASHRFAWLCQQAGLDYRFCRWTNPPHLRTLQQHSIAVGGLIVDWTYLQIDPKADWPHVEPLVLYARRFGPRQPICPTCGTAIEHDCHGLDEDPLAQFRWTAAAQRDVS